MLIGRKDELALLKGTLQDDRSHFAAVYGRRRIGKTFLIRESFGYRFTFQHAGVFGVGLKDQLFAFVSSIRDAGGTVSDDPRNWMEAFELLKELIRRSSEKKKILFIDELSWMDTRNSDLMPALEHFWNGWASARQDIVLIVCASATSWMLSKVVHNKEGLYNRLTEQIRLEPFTLAECEEYVRSMSMSMNRDQILQCYMVFGGVPYYWGFLKKGLSVPQNIDYILFAENAPLREEFDYLYASIFKYPAVYLRIIETLARKKAGMTREELIDASGLINSGDLTLKLTELENCGFIRQFSAFGRKKKGAVYQLTDFFSLFYYQFMAERSGSEHFWEDMQGTPTINTWQGLAFERVCLAHIRQIKQKLGISGVSTECNSWYCKPDQDNGIFGSQIDLLIVRRDQVINLCEMKYSKTEYTVTGKDDQSIRRKIHDLTTMTKTKYAVYPTLITSFGVVENSYAGNIQAVVTADDLFAE